MASKININLDTSKENYLVAKCKQNDDLTLEASIFENGLALDLTNKTITIQALKSDNTYIIQNTDIVKENNKINAELDRDFSRVPGTTKIEIVLVESSKQNTTFSFYLEVVGSVIRGAVQSSNTATILEALDNKIIEAGQVKQETEELVQSGGAATKGEVQEINASLEQNKKDVSNNELRKTSKSKSCATIIFDDCAYYDYQYLLPILKEKNIKVGLACLTDWVGTYNKDTQFMTWEQIAEFSDIGNEIISHSIRQDVKYDTLSDIELENYFKNSRNVLREKGYWSDLIAYTWGTSDTRIRKVARRYYRAGFAIWGQEIVQNSNGSTLNTYDIARVGLNGEDKLQGLFPSDTDSLDYLKARVDYAKANNQWLVLMGHSFMFKDTSKTKIQQFKDLIDYIKSIGMDIVIPTEGLQRMGNQIDLVANEDETKYFKVNSKGQMRSNINDVWDSDAFTGSNKLTDFRRGLTITSISTTKAQSDSKLPTNLGGTFITFRSFSDDLGYQDYIALNGLRFTRWAIDNKGNMSEWLNLLPPTQYNNTNIVIPSMTVPAKTTHNYTFTLTGITQINNIALYPTTNIETGLMFTHWIMPDNTVVLRFANMTDTAIITTERTWVANSIKLR